jgi:tetratricopeptide (TPR) repeat protein
MNESRVDAGLIYAPHSAVRDQSERSMRQARMADGGRATLVRGALDGLGSGRFAGAEFLASQAVADNPEDIEATLLLGLAIAAQGDARRAAPLLQQVAAARPNFAHPCRDLAQLRAIAPALVSAQFRACRALAPDDANLAYAYADFLLDAGSPAAAAAVLRTLLRQAPAFGPAHNLYGMALIDLGDIAAAIGAFRTATRLHPTEAATWANLGLALKIEGRFDEAIAAYDSAVAAAPKDAQIRLNRAVALLRAGRMAEAWPDYESRLRLGGGPRLPMDRLLPTLGADLDLAGRTILVWHEEGFGDSLQFARYVPLLAARGARVLAWVPPALARLFATLEGAAAVITEPAALPAYDWHCPFFSLPRAFATTLDSIPARLPYLFADPDLTARWAARLPADGLRVGLAWAGQARPWLPGFIALDRRRGMSLATLLPLAAIVGLSLVSLQLGPSAAEAAAPPRTLPLRDPMPEVTDFADTAAIIANLDVVVSVDTSVVHLAGALGKPVLLLDRYDSCWRWLSDRQDSPWYPGLRILRQQHSGDWTPVVAEAAALLAQMAGRTGARRGSH